MFCNLDKYVLQYGKIIFTISLPTISNGQSRPHIFASSQISTFFVSDFQNAYKLPKCISEDFKCKISWICQNALKMAHICAMCIYAPQITSRMSQISKNTRLGEDQYILKRSLRPTLFMSPLPDELICGVS